jgi:hypothetical protein
MRRFWPVVRPIRTPVAFDEANQQVRGTAELSHIVEWRKPTEEADSF